MAMVSRIVRGEMRVGKGIGPASIDRDKEKMEKEKDKTLNLSTMEGEEDGATSALVAHSQERCSKSF